MKGWSGITTVRMTSKDRDGDSGGFYFFFRARARRPPREGGHSGSPLPPPFGAISKHAFLKQQVTGTACARCWIAEITEIADDFHRTVLVLIKANERLVGDHDSANDKQGSRRGLWRVLFFLSRA